jgi:transmembrane sensor
VKESTTVDEAAIWAVRLEEGRLSPKDQEQLEAWLSAAPHRHGALIRARAVWVGLDRTAALERPRDIARGGESRTLNGDAAAPAPSAANTHWVRRAVGLAASIVAVTLALVALKAFLFPAGEYETRIGEVRRVVLVDGSAVTLNSDSRATVRLEKGQRRVELERGEALFDVAKDKSRPFTVWSGKVSVQAVGTVFEVRALPEDVSVTVTEGTVVVSQPDAAPQRVTINQHASVQTSKTIAVSAEDPSAIARQLSWRTGLLSFSGESLADAVREVNRYSQRQIEIDDPALEAQPIVGIFRIGDVDAFAQAAAAALKAEVHSDDHGVRLTAAHAP